MQQAIAFANENIIEPQGWGIEMDQVYDQTEYLESATALVESNIYVGGALAVLVLMLFLRDWRSVVVHGGFYTLSPNGATWERKEYERAVELLRTLIPETFTPADPTPETDKPKTPPCAKFHPRCRPMGAHSRRVMAKTAPSSGMTT